jgi:hypothetical protein
MGTVYAVELTAGPLAEGVDVAQIAGRLCEELNERDELDTAVGGDLVSRTIGLSAQIEAAGVDEALHAVVRLFTDVSEAAAGAVLPIIRAEVSFPSPPAASAA